MRLLHHCIAVIPVSNVRFHVLYKRCVAMNGFLLLLCKNKSTFVCKVIKENTSVCIVIICDRWKQLFHFLTTYNVSGYVYPYVLWKKAPDITGLTSVTEHSQHLGQKKAHVQQVCVRWGWWTRQWSYWRKTSVSVWLTLFLHLISLSASALVGGAPEKGSLIFSRMSHVIKGIVVVRSVLWEILKLRR